MSVVAMMGLCDDTTCIIKSTANAETLTAFQRAEGQRRVNTSSNMKSITSQG